MVNKKAANIARYGIMFAIIIVSVLLDRVITLGLPIAGATVELLVTFTMCFLFDSWLDGFAAFTFMGLSSFILAFPFAKIASQNPLISVLPRMFVGIAAFGVYKLVLMFFGQRKSQRTAQAVSLIAATFVGLVANTVLYMGALTLFTDMYGSLTLAIKSVAILNILPEYCVALAGISPLVLGVRRGLKLGADGDNRKRENVEIDISNTQKSHTYHDFCDKSTGETNEKLDEKDVDKQTDGN